MYRRLLLCAVVLVTFALIDAKQNVVFAQGGGPDIEGYCRNQGYSGATLVESNAYGWKCSANDGSTADIHIEDVCRQIYGDAAPKASYKDFENPYSWVCHTERITYHQNGWCSVVPTEVGYYGKSSRWNYNPRFQAYYDSMTNLESVEYFIYYQGTYVGEDISELEGPDHERGNNEWQFGIDTSWAAQHWDWHYESSWRIDYRCGF
jgi:hypothetical protein